MGELKFDLNQWYFEIVINVLKQGSVMKKMCKKSKPASFVVNRIAVLLLLIPAVSFCQSETLCEYLSGKGKDDAVEWDFFCTEGRNSGRWTKIQVPSQWELHGFGNYNYGHDKNKYNEQGKYKRIFSIADSWKGGRIKLVFEGVMTDTEVFVNSQSAGPIHQGGFYRFSYDITDLIKTGENLLEVNVSKVSANNSIEQAERKSDYWVFGGIYRPVYLEILPDEYIEWTAVDADADGSFFIDVYLSNVDLSDNVSAQIYTLDGSPLGMSFSSPVKKTDTKVRLSTKIQGHKLWTAESPDLYKIQLQLRQGTRPIHSVARRFGFRTFDVKPGDGLFLNGRKIRLKGTNRHSFWPDSGRCLSPELSYADVRLLKEMNMNAVRMSHYPPDIHFLEACDELGLYVLDELAGWQKPSYDTKTAERLIAQMIKRDQMHPCILFWDNGNEGGWNTEVDDEFNKYDPQQRRVLHPWDNFGGVDTDHYEKYSSVQNKVKGKDLYMPTEFLHGLYDGGHGAGLNDYWNLLGKSDLGAGGFLWCFCDEGVVRTDKNGVIDVDGNHAPDGIVGPYREKEGSFYTIKQVWSPVQLSLDEIIESGGIVDVENCYDFCNLNTCTFEWKITGNAALYESKEEQVMFKGSVRGPYVLPGEKGKLDIGLPDNWNEGDILSLTVRDFNKQELFTWSLNIKNPGDYLKRSISALALKPLNVEENGEMILISVGNVVARFSRKSGLLQDVLRNGKKLSLGNGPCAVPNQSGLSVDTTTPEVKVRQSKEFIALEVFNPGNGLSSLAWKMHAGGYLELACSYNCDGVYDFHGVTFDYPEDQVIAKQWLGDGPYRVWKNRLKGPQFGLWNLLYNNSIPGHIRKYPSFKGYFADMNWLSLDTKEGSFAVATDQENLFVRLFDPGDGPLPAKTKLPGFKGDISFLHAIPSIGTKFLKSEDLGPESQKTKASGEYKISLFFFLSGLMD